VEMAHRLVLGTLKGALMLLLPLRGAALEPLAEDVAGAIGSISKAADPSAEQAAQRAGAVADPFKELAFFVCSALDKAGFIAVVADVAVEGELEAGLGGIVLIVSGKGSKHLLPPS